MGRAFRLIKKYPNRRLYDTRASSFVTLADIERLVFRGEDFLIADAKSGEDLTRSVLLQIVLEEEGERPMLSSELLASMIRMHCPEPPADPASESAQVGQDPASLAGHPFVLSGSVVTRVDPRGRK